MQLIFFKAALIWFYTGRARDPRCSCYWSGATKPEFKPEGENRPGQLAGDMPNGIGAIFDSSDKDRKSRLGISKDTG